MVDYDRVLEKAGALVLSLKEGVLPIELVE